MNIVDPHHHIWNMTGLNYPWLNTGGGEVSFGNYAPLCRDYYIDDYKNDCRNQNVVKSVHIQAEHDHSDPVAEVRWVQGVADDPASGGYPHGIVGYADFSSDEVSKTLDAYREFPNMRGIRQVLSYYKTPTEWDAPKDYMKDPLWRQNLSRLEKHGLHFELQIYPNQMEEGAAFLNSTPNVQFILTHAGHPVDLDEEGVRAWRAGMTRLAACENLAAKISGLGMYIPGWTEEKIRPFVLDTIEIFGIERCMFGSNFPVDSLFGTYDALYDAFKSIASAFSDNERRKLFHDNAVKYYRLA